MVELVKTIAMSLVDHPEAVSVCEKEKNMTVKNDGVSIVANSDFIIAALLGESTKHFIKESSVNCNLCL